MRKSKKLVLAVLAAALPIAAFAEGGPDMSAVTSGLTSTGAAILAVAGTVAAGAMGLMAIKFGGKWVVKLWKSFTS